MGNRAELANVVSSGGSVSAWLNARGNFGRIIDKASSTDLGSGWEMHVDRAGCPQQSFRFEHDFQAHWGAWETGAATILLNRWYNVAVTYDSSSSANEPALYIDGSRVAHSEREVPAGESIDDSAVRLWLGDHSGVRARNFNGSVDEVRIFATIRSSEWLRAEYLAVTGAMVVPGQVESLP